jgi:hypothetical protein
MPNETIGYCVKSPVNHITTTKLSALMRPIIKIGGLNLVSFVRPSKLFTANAALFNKNIATLTDAAHEKVIRAILQILKNGK